MLFFAALSIIYIFWKFDAVVSSHQFWPRPGIDKLYSGHCSGIWSLSVMAFKYLNWLGYYWWYTTVIFFSSISFLPLQKHFITFKSEFTFALLDILYWCRKVEVNHLINKSRFPNQTLFLHCKPQPVVWQPAFEFEVIASKFFASFTWRNGCCPS